MDMKLTNETSDTKKWNRRTRTIATITIAALFIITILILSFVVDKQGLVTNLSQKDLGPSLKHPFGTDWLGRDMFTRTILGLRLSIFIGAVATSFSLLIGLILGLIASSPYKAVDRAVTWFVDLFQSLPHVLFIILISILVGRGIKGVIIGVAVTHWTMFTRLVRAEVLQLKTNEYIALSRKMGKSGLWIATRHIFPHIVPMLFNGFVLTFPHAILHEAGISFLGFGLAAHQPAIGIILSESMRYIINGMWWLVMFPGLSLFLVVLAILAIGENLRVLYDPRTAHE